MYETIKENAKAAKTTEERFIAEILNRYVLDAHIMNSKDVCEGYIECGPLNLELANL